jgi:hypothetical protein
MPPCCFSGSNILAFKTHVTIRMGGREGGRREVKLEENKKFGHGIKMGK